MLPSLSRSLNANVQVVVPVIVDPAAITARRRALLELKKVVTVRVPAHTSRGDRVQYTVETVTDTGSNSALLSFNHLPRSTPISSASITSRSATEEEPSRSEQQRCKPTIRTKKSLEEFVDLRNQVYYAAHTAHPHEPCKFCTDVIEYLFIQGTKPDSLTLRLLGEERAKRKLTRFVADILDLVMRGSTIEARRPCHGQIRVPQLLYEFLFTAATEAGEAA